MEIVEEDQKKQRSSSLSEIMSPDETYLFNLQTLSDLQKNDKLMVRDNLIAIDNRTFKSAKRWLSADSRVASATKVFECISKTEERVRTLLAEDYAFTNCPQEDMTEQDKKLNTESNEERQRLITKYRNLLITAKNGLNNIIGLYDEQFVKNSFSLSMNKITDLLVLLE